MLKNGQTLSLLAIVFFGFVSLSLPYPIFSPLFLHPESQLFSTLRLSLDERVLLLGLTLAAYPFAQFFGSPILGGLSDRFGRKQLLVLTLIGTGFGYLLSGLAIAQHQVEWLIFSRLLTGFFEGNMGIAQASISDLKLDKHIGLGAISAISSLGYLVGPLIGGFLCDKTLLPWFDAAIPFYFGTILAISLGIGVALFYRETFQPTKKNTSLLSELNIFTKIHILLKNAKLRSAFLVMIFLSLSIDCYYEFYPAYMVAQWEMTPKTIGLYSATLSLALSIGSLWLPQWLKNHNKPAFYRLPLSTIYVFSLLALLFVSGTILLNLHFLLVGLAYSAFNTIQNVIISDQAASHEQGEVMGLQWGLRMLGDSLLCLLGSMLLMHKGSYPIILSVLLAMITLVIVSLQKRKDIGTKLSSLQNP